MPSRDDPGREIDPAKGWRGLRSTYQERGPSRPGPTTAQSAQLNTPRRERRGYARAVEVTFCSRFPLQNAQGKCMRIAAEITLWSSLKIQYHGAP